MSDSKESAVNFIFNGIAELSDYVGEIFKVRPIIVKWIIIVILIVIATTVFYYVESQSRFMYFSALERRVSILKELNQLSNEGIASKKELNPIYVELISELSEGKVYPMNFQYIQSTFVFIVALFSSPLFWPKFISGAILGFILIIWTLASKREDIQKRKALIGALIITVAFGFVGIFIPVKPTNLITNLIVNAFALALVQIFLLSYIGHRSLVKKSLQTN